MIKSIVLYCIFNLSSKINTVLDLYQVGAQQGTATVPFKLKYAPPLQILLGNKGHIK